MRHSPAHPSARMRRALLAAEKTLPPLTGVVPRWPGHPVTLDGLTLYVRETPPAAGRLPPALYLHGLGGSSTNWTDLAALLSGRVAGTAIDLPGSGYSPPAPRYTMTALAEQVIRWVDQARCGPVHLFGNSLGGTLAVVVAARRPDLVRSLILVSPALPFLDPRRSLQSRVVPLLAVPQGRRIARRLLDRIPPERLARQVVEACFADPRRLAPQRFTEAVEEVRLRYTADHYLDAYLRSMRALVASFLRAYLPGGGSLWRLAATVTAPTLVIGGRQDRLVDVRVAPHAAAAIPDARLLMLDGVGHVAQLEAPRTVARATLAFLDEVADGVPAVHPVTEGVVAD